MKNCSCLLTLAIAGVFAGGCGTPTVHIQHVLPAAVPVGDYRTVQLGQLAVEPQAPASLQKDLLRVAREQLATAQPPQGSVFVGTGDLAVDVQLRIDAVDHAGKRSIQSGSGPKQVPSLVRTVEVTATFVVEAARVELRRKWTSTADPRVRGELGLLRPDDPARVPDQATVVGELFAECVRRFVTMIIPPMLTAEVPLKGLGAIAGKSRAALDAAHEGDYAAAAEAFKALLAGDPNNEDLQFNLAVTSEAAGDLQTAAEMYAKAAAHVPPDKLPKDIAAGINRVQLVSRHRPAAKK